MPRVDLYLTQAQDVYVRRLAREAGGQPSDIIRGLVALHMRQSRAQRPVSGSQALMRALLVKTLREHGGNVSEAARALGEHRRTIQRRMRRLDITASDYSSEKSKSR